MTEEIYNIPARPQYSTNIRKLQDSDPASASQVFNPLFERIIENIAAVRNQLAAAQRIDIVIPTEGWTNDGGTEKYPYYLDIPEDVITEDTIPNLTVLPEGENTAIACGLASFVQTLDEALRVFAAAVPENPIPASLTLQGSGGNLSGGYGGLPIATAYQAGAVKPGTGLTVAPDGTLSLNMASDAEINQMLAEVFASDNK